MPTTFVSAYFPYRATPFFDQRPEESDPGHILHLIGAGIRLCLFIASDCPHRALFHQWAADRDNFRIMPRRLPRDYTETDIYRIWTTANAIELPWNRNADKDTVEYIVWSHSRAEWMADAIRYSPFGETDTDSFAWIDSNAARLFSDKPSTLNYLSTLGSGSGPNTDTNTHLFDRRPDAVYIPGCSAKMTEEFAAHIADHVYWRFCAGFVFARKPALLAFCARYLREFAAFAESHTTLVWDVNFLAYLELKGAADIVWFRADHNDSLVRIHDGVSADTYAVSVRELARINCGGNVRQQEYAYPEIANYHPGSASYVNWRGQDIINTRYVSYWMRDDGGYTFPTDEFVIRNKNLASVIDPRTAKPAGFQEMDVDNPRDCAGEVMKRPCGEDRKYISRGFEDVRLYVGASDELKFIATNIDYSPIERNRMVVGNYDLVRGEFFNCAVVVPPDADSWCEKNWTPVIAARPQNGSSDQAMPEEKFIYKWWPMEIGKIEDGRLRICETIPLVSRVFRKLRGSTSFVDYLPDPTMIIGLTHFSEEYSPRHYYHVLVLLDKLTLVPRFYSDVFFFEKLSIEFCTGFQMVDTGLGAGLGAGLNAGLDAGLDAGPSEYAFRFWISRMDRDPLFIEIDAAAIPVKHTAE